jgi:hypothetical protein
MWTIATLLRALLALLALRGLRWAYVAFIVLGIAYFPARTGFRLHPHACEVAFGPRLAAHSLTNFAHIALFALFFVFSCFHFAARRPVPPHIVVRATAITLAMGAMVEAAEGLTGAGNCRLRDLIPDSAGILLGVAAIVGLRRAAPRLFRFAPRQFFGGR